MAGSKSEIDQVADDLTRFLVNAPPWAGPTIAVVVYLLLNVLWPLLLASAALPIAQLGPKLAPIAATLILVIWGIAEFKKRTRRQLLQHNQDLDAMSWQDFELYVGEAFRQQGYSVTEAGGSAPDGGVDLILDRDGERFLVQCKHWRKRSVGVKTIRELYGVLVDQGANGAKLVSGGTFTTEARAFAQGKPIALIDGEALRELVGNVQERPKQQSSPTAKTCPGCNAPMVKRTAKRGANAGAAFWGCSTYPKCKTTRPM